jgi:hypothetical protein
LRDALRYPGVAASSVLLDELSAPPRDAPRDTDRQDAMTDPGELVPS